MACKGRGRMGGGRGGWRVRGVVGWGEDGVEGRGRVGGGWRRRAW